MTAGIRRRLDRLERAAAAQPGICPECGHGAGGTWGNGGDGRATRFRVLAGRPGEPDPGPEFCPACGRQLVFTIKFDTAG